MGILEVCEHPIPAVVCPPKAPQADSRLSDRVYGTQATRSLRALSEGKPLSPLSAAPLATASPAGSQRSPAAPLHTHPHLPQMQQRTDVVKLFVGQIPKTLEEDGVREGAQPSAQPPRSGTHFWGLLPVLRAPMPAHP